LLQALKISLFFFLALKILLINNSLFNHVTRSLSMSAALINFASNHVVLPLAINTYAGAATGAIFGIDARITMLSGAISGALQTLATPFRGFLLTTLDEKLEGTAKAVAKAIAFFGIYAVHIPVLMATAKFGFDTELSLAQASALTAFGSAAAALPYLSAQRLIDQAASSGVAPSLF
jgi:hypothetical protein